MDKERCIPFSVISESIHRINGEFFFCFNDELISELITYGKEESKEFTVKESVFVNNTTIFIPNEDKRNLEKSVNNRIMSNLKKEMTAKGHTQKELASILHISESLFSTNKRRDSGFSAAAVVYISIKYSISLKSLLAGVKDIIKNYVKENDIHEVERDHFESKLLQPEIKKLLSVEEKSDIKTILNQLNILLKNGSSQNTKELMNAINGVITSDDDIDDLEKIIEVIKQIKKGNKSVSNEDIRRHLENFKFKDEN
jgi:transcriptional regulator with XRE-family HTH domain